MVGTYSLEPADIWLGIAIMAVTAIFSAPAIVNHWRQNQHRHWNKRHTVRDAAGRDNRY